jgi:hypothetical protein
MLPDSIVTTARQLTNGTLSTMDGSFLAELSRAKSDLHARGLLRSSNAASQCLKLANAELRTIAETIWGSLRTALEANPQPFDEQLLVAVQGAFNLMQVDFNSRVIDPIRTLAAISGAHTAAAVEASVLTFSAKLNQKYMAQIAIWVSQGQTASVAAQRSPMNQYNFHAPVGAVQTGPDATANIHQQFDSAEVEKLIDGLREFSKQLNAMPVPDPVRRHQVIAVTTELEAELKAPTPNRFKLQSIFKGISTFVQTLAVAPDAYQNIENILRALGLL